MPAGRGQGGARPLAAALTEKVAKLLKKVSDDLDDDTETKQPVSELLKQDLDLPNDTFTKGVGDFVVDFNNKRLKSDQNGDKDELTLAKDTILESFNDDVDALKTVQLDDDERSAIEKHAKQQVLFKLASAFVPMLPKPKSVRQEPLPPPLDILFVTNRFRVENHQPVIFTHKRSPTMQFGTCHVTPKQGPKRIRLACRVSGATEKIEEVAPFKACKKLIVLVPGYNQSFDQAVKCVYELRYRYEKKGMKFDNEFQFAAFSWPGRGDYGLMEASPLSTAGQPLAYLVDLAACEASEACIPEFADRLIKIAPNLTELHFLGHSMGCRLLLRGIARLSPEIRDITRSITFASPDADRDMFQNLLGAVAGGFRQCKFLLMMNNKDQALKVSEGIHLAPRAGLISTADQTYTYVKPCVTIDSSDLPNTPKEYIFWGDGLMDQIRHFDFIYKERCYAVMPKMFDSSVTKDAFAAWLRDSGFNRLDANVEYYKAEPGH